MIFCSLLSRWISIKGKQLNRINRSADDHRVGTWKSPWKRLVTTIGEYRAALCARKVSVKVSESSLIQNSELLTSQAPAIKPIKKIITLEEYKKRQQCRSKIIKTAPVKLTQFQSEETETLEDITSYLLAFNKNKRKHDGEDLEEENMFACRQKKPCLFH